MRSEIHARTSSATNATRRSPIGTAAGKLPSARYRFNIDRESEVICAAVFSETNMALSFAAGIVPPSVGMYFHRQSVAVHFSRMAVKDEIDDLIIILTGADGGVSTPAECCPIGHQRSPFLKGVASTVTTFDVTTDSVAQRPFR
jgi:hypothetical protein